jgi:hypothetical protein
MEKPFVIRFSQESSNEQETKLEDYMVDDVVSYFTRRGPGGHGRKAKKKARKSSEYKDYYFV